MDFINKLINRPKSLPASTAAAAGMASDIQIESLLAEIQENLHHKNQNNTNSPGASSGKLQQTPTSAGPEASNNNILKLATTPTLANSKHQSPSKSETPTSGKKFTKQNSQNNFRNAFLLDEDKSDELPDIVKVNPIPHQVLVAHSVVDSPTTAALKAFEKLGIESPPVAKVTTNNPTSSTEHSDDEFTECQSYSALNATTNAAPVNSEVFSEQLPPDSTTKSANTTQEIAAESAEKTLSLSLNRSFPILKPQQTTFPVTPTPDDEIKYYKGPVEEKKLEVPLNPPEILIQTPSNFEKKLNTKRISFPSTPDVKEDEGTVQFPRAPTPDEAERQSIATLNGTFAASSEALNSTINIQQQDKNTTFEAEDEKTAVVNLTASFMSANATIPIHKVDSGFASTNLEENQNVTSASFESANQTLNLEVNTTHPLNTTTSAANKTAPVAEDDCLNVTTSGELDTLTSEARDINTQSFEAGDTKTHIELPEENDCLNVTTSGISEDVGDALEVNTTAPISRAQVDSSEENQVNTTTNIEEPVKIQPEAKPVDLQDTMCMDVDMEEGEIDTPAQGAEEKHNHHQNSPMDVEDVEMDDPPAAFKRFDSTVDFLSDKEKHNAANEKEKETGCFAGIDAFQAFDRDCRNEVPNDDEFSGAPKMFFDPSAFEFLEGKGNKKQEEVDIRRTSLLLRFDPLCQQLQPDLKQTPKAALNDLKEEEPIPENEAVVVVSAPLLKLNQTVTETETTPSSSPGIQITTKSVKKNEKMSVGVIQEMPMENNDIKSFENLSSQINEKQMKMDDEPENKAKNEVSRNDEIEKKLKDSEQREEALLKRITEKDKTIAKMTGVIEAYEKAIAELIAEKEQLSQNFDKELSEVKADRDTNYYHLTSLETTFSDLNIKYEKNKELLSQVKASEEKLLAERKVNGENLKLQEQRYEKMKTHAMMQLEIANQKIEDYRKQHTIETTRLKALLKKEEISRAAVSDQLQQKAKENEQLMKICDELINSQQPS